MRKPIWDSIVLHCTYDVGQQDKPLFFDWKTIVDYHVNVRHYDYVGYHAGIERLNGHLVVCPGRPLSREGAHCLSYGMNWKAIGLAVVGNFDLQPPDRETYFLVARVCQLAMLKYPAITIDRIFPHSHFSPKTCPGKMFDVDKVKYLIKNI